MNKYILKNGQPVIVDDIVEWAGQFEKLNRKVKSAIIKGVNISTVFLGLDHSFNVTSGPSSDPVLWETLVFGGKLDGEMERYTSIEDAIYGHDLMVKRVKESMCG